MKFSTEDNIFFILFLLILPYSNCEYDINLLKKKIDTYINNENFTQLKDYLNEIHKKKINFVSFLNKTISNKITLMKINIFKLLDKYRRNSIEISPAFSWSETSYDITLEIYFSRSTNGNSCGELEEKNYELNKNKTFIFNGKCVIDDEDALLRLNITFYKEISLISEVINARKQITFKFFKKKPGEWFRLLDDGVTLPNNMYRK